MIKIQQYLYIVFLTLLFLNGVSAQESTPETEVLLPVHDLSHCTPDGLALGGYDAVSYHINDTPIFGDEQFKAEYQGMFYQFSSQENLDTFNVDPEKYLPAFSGWCAIALALGKLTCPDYTNYKIENGRLLLFETFAFSNGRHVWDGNPMRYFEKAISNYEEFSEPQL